MILGIVPIHTEHNKRANDGPPHHRASQKYLYQHEDTILCQPSYFEKALKWKVDRNYRLTTIYIKRHTNLIVYRYKWQGPTYKKRKFYIITRLTKKSNIKVFPKYLGEKDTKLWFSAIFTHYGYLKGATFGHKRHKNKSKCKKKLNSIYFM